MEALSRRVPAIVRRRLSRSSFICIYATAAPASCRHFSAITPRTSRLERRPQLSHIRPLTHVRLFQISHALSSNSKFTYGIAASFTAKDKKFNPSTNVFNFDPYAPIIKKRKDKRTRPASGQDAFFISRVGKSGDVAFGVADGVGGWADSGVDPADFSHQFCDYMAYAASTCPSEEARSALNARALMQKGYDSIVQDLSISAGGSTACVGIAKEDGSFEVANLGDSGFMQLRLNAIHNLSEPQTHAFNTPYQLSVIPKQMQALNAAFGGEQLHDMPKDASVTKHSLRHGDVIIFATDGVWDNLSSQDILKVVSRLMIGSGAWENTEDGIRVGERLFAFTRSSIPESNSRGVSSLQSFLSVGIAGEAKAASVNRKVDGPFAREVHKYFPEEDWRGGKVDDICVVVAVVVEQGR